MVQADAAPGAIERVSVPDGGGERNVLPTGTSLQCNAQNAGKCTKRAVAYDSANNKVRVVYSAAANNIVPNDANGKADIFLTTLAPSATPGAAPTIESVERINIGPAGVEANGESQGPSISPNGQWVSFDSMASNLVPNDNNAANDVFAYNVLTKALYRASVAQPPAMESTGASFASSIANDGTTSFTSYNALTQGAVATFQQVYVRKSPAGTPVTELVSENAGGSSSGNAPSLESSISADATKIAFTTQADDVVPGKTKSVPDIVVRDMSNGTSRLVTVNASAGAPSLSGNGSVVAFIADGIQPPKKGIYKVGVNGTAGPGDLVADCQTPACASKPPKPSVLPSLSEDGSMLVFQSASRFLDAINSEQAWFGTGNAGSPLLMSQRMLPPAGEQAAGGAINPSLSSDGKWVVFETAAGNLVDDDFNGAVDIYLAQVGTAGPTSVSRVSVPAAGGEASGFALSPTAAPSVSADGNVIAFESDSSNLVGGDTNGVNDVFVRDRGGAKTFLVSVATGGEQANGASFRPGLSADGRFVVFESVANNLVGPGADSNNLIDVFIHDRQTGETKRVSDNPQQPHASRNPSISRNGKFVVFESTGSWGMIANTRPDVKQVYRWSNPAAGGDGATLMLSTQPPSGNNPNRKAGGRDSFEGSVADDGSAAFLSNSHGLTGFNSDDPEGVKPNYTDVFVSLPSDTVVKASMSDSPNADGSGRQTPAAGDSYRPSISADGRFVAFASDATNMPVDGADQNPDTDVFVRDIHGGSTRLVSAAPGGVAGGASTNPAINTDGSAVAFVSTAPNLAGNDNNGAPDVFLANMANGGISRISARPGVDGHQADGSSYMPGISGNGLIIAFGSSATNLVDGDSNAAYDIFIRSLSELPSPCVDCGRGGQSFSGPGYRFVAADGGIFSFGDAKFFGSAGATKLAKPIVGMASTPSNGGYWLVASDGGIFSYGDAKFFGSTGDLRLNSPIVGMTGSPTGQGYWFVAADGGIFSFGDATFFGSMGGQPLSKPIVGMSSTPSGQGYWLVASDGGIFSYGDATFHGSTGDIKLARPIVGMDRTNTGSGYRFVASDGGIFSFGDAAFLGSMGGKPLAKPIVDLARTRTGDGYWLVASDGGIFSFGNAGFQGSTGDIKLAQPIVGMAG